MTQIVNKCLVRERFRKRLANYSKHADVQNKMAHHLIDAVLAKKGKLFPRALEIGCGAGTLTSLIADSMDVRAFFANDLIAEAQTAVEHIATRRPTMSVQFICGDIESDISLPGNLDLIISNATFQWLECAGDMMLRLSDLLSDNGALAFSTFGPDNFREIRELTGNTLAYPSAQTIQGLLARNYRILHQSESIISMHFPSPLDVLKHIRHTGANALKKESWQQASLRNFLRAYIERWSVDEEVSLTYHPITFVVEKL